MRIKQNILLFFCLMFLAILIGLFFITNQYNCVKKVIDGDTVILNNNEIIRVRNINAPELSNPLGPKVKSIAKELLKNNCELTVFNSQITGEKNDIYGRTIGDFKLNNGYWYSQYMLEWGYVNKF